MTTTANISIRYIKDSVDPIIVRGEANITQLMNDIGNLAPDELNQAALLKAQTAVSAWGLAVNTLSGLTSAVATSLKAVAQNIR